MHEFLNNVTTTRYAPTAKCVRAAVGDPDPTLYKDEQVRFPALSISTVVEYMLTLFVLMYGNYFLLC
jgi:hypothetical protein